MSKVEFGSDSMDSEALKELRNRALALLDEIDALFERQPKNPFGYSLLGLMKVSGRLEKILQEIGVCDEDPELCKRLRDFARLDEVYIKPLYEDVYLSAGVFMGRGR